MFTERRIALSSLADAAGLNVIRDAQIAFAGKIPTQLNARLVPASRAEHLRMAESFDGIAAFIVPASLADQAPRSHGLVIDERPLAALSRVQTVLSSLPDFQWERFESRISASADIAASAVVARHDVNIGEGARIGPNACILPRSLIGAHVVLGAGVVIGMEAFDEATHGDHRALLEQSGGVWIGEHVTIQANSTISRSAFGGFTTIGSNTLIDALVYIAHDCKIGENVTICSGASVSGRVTIEDGAYIGPHAAISNGVTIGKNATVSIGSTVTRDVDASARVTGNFALPHEKWLGFLRKFR